MTTTLNINETDRAALIEDIVMGVLGSDLMDVEESFFQEAEAAGEAFGVTFEELSAAGILVEAWKRIG
jgi:hypothetical protein